MEIQTHKHKDKHMKLQTQKHKKKEEKAELLSSVARHTPQRGLNASGRSFDQIASKKIENKILLLLFLKYEFKEGAFSVLEDE